MNYIKFNPFLPLQDGVDDLVQSIFNNSIGDFVGSDFVSSHPKANVLEGDDGYRVQIAAPGLSKDSFQIKIEKNQLIITSEKNEESGEAKKGFTRREFNYAGFKRTFPLNDGIDKDTVSASYKDGVLEVHLPKMQNHNPEKTIVIS